jgi:4-amino-4-deoxy-L-arabinose transferase-like glycosyltransferase
MVLVLLLAAGLRLVGLDNLSPPGLAHDEVANWLIDRAILAGNHGLYFTEAYGHEAGFHYVQAGFIALVGDHALALRLPAAFAGLFVVAITYALARRLFNQRIALFAAALLAVLFWPVFFSRLGLRAIFLPLVSGLSAYAWWRAFRLVPQKPAHSATDPFDTRPGTNHILWLLAAGVLAGLSLYTYMAARAVPIFYALFLIYLLLFQRHLLRRMWPGLLLFWIVLAVVAAPLTLFLLNNPGAEFRISEIDMPLQALRAGDLRPVLENTVRILGAFGIQGDPLWRQNVPPRPVFDLLTALLFYLALPLALWRIRDARFAFVLLWTGTAFIPSMVTSDAPSTIRMINVLPTLTLLPALVMHSLYRLSTVHPQLSTKSWITQALKGLTILIVLFHLGRTAGLLFLTWPQNEEVQFVWQAALTDAAGYLDKQPENNPVAVGGWTPETMDPPTLALTLKREDLALRFFDPRDALIIPGEEPARIIYPTVLPLAPFISEQLTRAGIQPDVYDRFMLVNIPAGTELIPTLPVGEILGEELQLVGLNLHDTCFLADNAPCQILTYWQVIAPIGEPRRIFLHVLDENDQIIAQDDRLNAPAEHWQVGDLILQVHFLEIDELGSHPLRIGVYHPQTGRRLLTPAGEDALFVLPP